MKEIIATGIHVLWLAGSVSAKHPNLVAKAPRLSSLGISRSDPYERHSQLSNWENSVQSQDEFAHGDFQPCDAQCTIEGISAKCSARIEYSAQHEFWGSHDKCEHAHHRVSTQCEGTCKGCTVKASGCHEKFYWRPEWGSTTTPTTTTPGPITTRSEGCLTMCEIDGDNRTCKEQIQRIAEDRYSLAPISCSLAYGWVLEKCAHCSVCPTIRSTCTTAPTTSHTSSTSTRTSTTDTTTSTGTSSTSTLTRTMTSTTTTSKTTTMTSTTITTSSTVTTTLTSTTTSSTTTTPRPWFSMPWSGKVERVDAALWHPNWRESMVPLLSAGVFGSFVVGAIMAVVRASNPRRVHGEHRAIFASVNREPDPELNQALAGVE